MISKDMKKLGFKFVGNTIIYSYLQAVGVIAPTLEGFIFLTRVCRPWCSGYQSDTPIHYGYSSVVDIDATVDLAVEIIMNLTDAKVRELLGQK